MAPVSIEQNFSKTIPLGEYLFLRINQFNENCKSIFGIPGDFNLNLLEHLYSSSITSKKIEFVGLCNELNAAYTADGYSRLVGLGVLITTYGVGELSAINGISGAYSEYSPVLHIVGTSSTKQKEFAVNDSNQIKNIHHLIQAKNALNKPDHYVYEKMVEPLSVVTESLYDIDNACEQIDNCLRTILSKARPGYLYIPSDLPDMMVPEINLNKPIFPTRSNIDENSDYIVDKICEFFYNSKDSSILGDALIRNFGSKEIFDKLIEKIPSKLFSTNLSKGLIDESLSNYVGTYFGLLSASKEIRQSIENSDFVLHIGSFNVETNTGGYSFNFSKVQNYVEINPDYININGKIYRNDKNSLTMRELLSKLYSKLDKSKIQKPEINYKYTPVKFCTSSSNRLDQNYLIDTMNNYLQPNDTLVIETCAFIFAIADLKFPANTSYISQNFYGSIGFALPATLGVSLAKKDLKQEGRVILIQGDGSAQMTIQELASYLRYDITPTIFLINNDGYTVERIIKGATRSYNDIAPNWQWCDFFKVFGDVEAEKHFATKITSKTELDEILEDKTFKQYGKIQLLELILDRMDAPGRFDFICGKRDIKELLD